MTCPSMKSQTIEKQANHRKSVNPFDKAELDTDLNTAKPARETTYITTQCLKAPHQAMVLPLDLWSYMQINNFLSPFT